MKKRELISLLETFDEASDVVFVEDYRDLVNLDADAVLIAQVVEVNNGVKKVIALME